VVESVKDQVKGIRTALTEARAATAEQDAAFAAQTATLRDQQAVYDSGATARQTALRAEQTASDGAAQHRIDGLHAQVSALQEAYRLEDARIALTRDSTQLGVDQAEAVNRFSASGAAARTRVIADQAKIEDDQRKATRQGALDGLQDRITAEETAKKRADEGFTALLTALDTERRTTDANFAAEQRAIADRKRAYDEATATRVRQTEAAIRTLEAADKGAVDRTLTAQQTALDQFNADSVATSQANAVAGDSILDRYGDVRAAKVPKLLESIFGTKDQQQDAGYRMADSVITGMGTAINAWTKGKGNPIMNFLMGGKNPDEAFKNWVGQVAGVENLGGDLAKALFPENKGLVGKDSLTDPHLAGTGPTSPTPPATQPPGTGPGHYIDGGGGHWMWREDDPTVHTMPPPAAVPSLPTHDSTTDRYSSAANPRHTINITVTGFVGSEGQLAGHISGALADQLYGGRG